MERALTFEAGAWKKVFAEVMSHTAQLPYISKQNRAAPFTVLPERYCIDQRNRSILQ